MRILTRLAAAAAVFAVAAGAAQAKDWSKLRIGVDATYPPFEYTGADGQIVGFSPEIAKALCEKIKAECEFMNQAWDGIIPALQANKFDAIISSMSITEERKKQVDFTGKYYNTPPAIIVPKDSTLKEATPEALAGITIGAQGSTTHANYIQEILNQSELKAYPSPDEYKLDLANGRLDAAVDDSTVLDAFVKSPEGACCRILAVLKSIPAIHGEGAGIAVRKEDSDLRDLLDQALKDIRADGTYKKINDKYFAFDVYGS